MANTAQGIYYPNNYDSVADIPNDMQKMAESVDKIVEDIKNNDTDTEQEILELQAEQSTQNTKIETLEKDNTTNKQDILDIQTKNTEQDTNIQNNAESIEELKAENERLNNDINAISVTEQAEGENITLNDTAEARFKKFGIGGNSWQETSNQGNNMIGLLDMEEITVSGVTISISNQELTLNGTATANINQALGFQICNNFEVGKSYTGSYNCSTSISGTTFFLNNSDNTIIARTTSNGGKYTLEMLENNVPNKLSIYISNGSTFENHKLKLMINEGTEKMDWEAFVPNMPSPNFKSDIQNVTGNANIKITNGLEDTDTNYQDQSFPFPLAEGQKLMINDYLADDRIHHKRKQVAFDGTENWTFGNIKENTVNVLLNDFQGYNATGTDSINAMCNYFVGIAQGASSDKECFWFNGSGGFRIKINKDRLADTSTNDKCVESFKSLLAELYANGTPVVVEYDLAEEEIEAYTAEQQAVYDEIKKTAHSYKNITHIFSTDETSPIVRVEYRKDTETYINNKIEAITNAVIELGGTVNV